MASRIPPLLEPYLRLPLETSLIVLTGVLGASTNWLVQRHIHSLLATPSRAATAGDDGHEVAGGDHQASVLLVSYLRDYAFWKDGAGRIGIDLDALSRKGRFAFVDGLSELFCGPRSVSDDSKNGRALSDTALQDLRRSLNESVMELQQNSPGSKIVLILDSPDLLLAATGNKVSGEALRETLLDIREKVHSSIVTLAADESLISTQATSLEKEHAAFALALAHEAEIVISLRMLDTGTARDVSGVLRATHGGGSTGYIQDKRELLYFVGGDGGVRVFERGQ